MPYVEPHVLGAPVPGLLHEIRQAAIGFCERTWVWKERDTVSIRGGTGEYDIPTPPGGSLVMVESVRVGGERLKPATPDDLNRLWRDWETVSGQPTVYTQFSDTIITLAPKPDYDLAAGLSIRASYKPTRSAEKVPDILFDNYADAIGHGAVARVLETRGNPYGDPRLAVYHAQQFESAINQALMQAARGFTRAPLRTRAYF